MPFKQAQREESDGPVVKTAQQWAEELSRLAPEDQDAIADALIGYAWGTARGTARAIRHVSEGRLRSRISNQRRELRRLNRNVLQIRALYLDAIEKRDEWRCECLTITTQARERIASLEGGIVAENRRVAAEIDRLTRERDEARAAFAEEDREHDLTLKALDECMTERDALRAELAAERAMSAELACVLDGKAKEE